MLKTEGELLDEAGRLALMTLLMSLLLCSGKIAGSRCCRICTDGSRTG